MRLIVATTIICLSAMLSAQAFAQSNNTISAWEMFKLAENETDPYWKTAEREVYKSLDELSLQNAEEIKSGMLPKKITHGAMDRREVAITFDDGPHPKFTPQILDILRRSRTKATFFLVGMMAEKYPDLVRAELKDGHNIGNHTYHHVSLTKIPVRYIAPEIEACADVLQKEGVKSLHLFRPPGGDYNADVARLSNDMGYTIVLWTDDPGDYSSPGKQVIIRRLLDKLDNGGIILIHDGIQETIDVLPTLLEEIKQRGYSTVTIDELQKHMVKTEQ